MIEQFNETERRELEIRESKVSDRIVSFVSGLIDIKPGEGDNPYVEEKTFLLNTPRVFHMAGKIIVEQIAEEDWEYFAVSFETHSGQGSGFATFVTYEIDEGTGDFIRDENGKFVVEKKQVEYGEVSGGGLCLRTILRENSTEDVFDMIENTLDQLPTLISNSQQKTL